LSPERPAPRSSLPHAPGRLGAEKLGRTDEQGIAGWAFDASEPERVVAVDIYDGETGIARVDAGCFRADLLRGARTWR